MSNNMGSPVPDIVSPRGIRNVPVSLFIVCFSFTLSYYLYFFSAYGALTTSSNTGMGLLFLPLFLIPEAIVSFVFFIAILAMFFKWSASCISLRRLFWVFGSISILYTVFALFIFPHFMNFSLSVTTNQNVHVGDAFQYTVEPSGIYNKSIGFVPQIETPSSTKVHDATAWRSVGTFVAGYGESGCHIFITLFYCAATPKTVQFMASSEGNAGSLNIFPFQFNQPGVYVFSDPYRSFPPIQIIAAQAK